ncbi:MAG TPA: ABC transporter permease subunit [Vicinamibacterales bacterium]|nr:ABC transporter permease subunit [Vicinamibacterales bacterium]
MNVGRIGAIVEKELRELRSNPSAVLPVAILVTLCLTVPFLVLVVMPQVTGESLSADPALRQIVEKTARSSPRLAALQMEAAVEAFMYQQFLLLFLVAPIVGAVSLAAYSVVGEKQGRTLEPLLATPLTTAELLVAKVVAAFLPAIAIEAVGLLLYVLLVFLLASPGVPGALVNARSIVLVGIVGPIGALAALQMTIAISSRVNDPRSAQQIAVLLVVPLVVMVIGQIAGALVITVPILLVVAAVLAIVWVLLILLSMALFERETILTRWK